MCQAFGLKPKTTFSLSPHTGRYKTRTDKTWQVRNSLVHSASIHSRMLIGQPHMLTQLRSLIPKMSEPFWGIHKAQPNWPSWLLTGFDLKSTGTMSPCTLIISHSYYIYYWYKDNISLEHVHLSQTQGDSSILSCHVTCQFWSSPWHAWGGWRSGRRLRVDAAPFLTHWTRGCGQGDFWSFTNVRFLDVVGVEAGGIQLEWHRFCRAIPPIFDHVLAKWTTRCNLPYLSTLPNQR